MKQSVETQKNESYETGFPVNCHSCFYELKK